MGIPIWINDAVMEMLEERNSTSALSLIKNNSGIVIFNRPFELKTAHEKAMFGNQKLFHLIPQAELADQCHGLSAKDTRTIHSSIAHILSAPFVEEDIDVLREIELMLRLKVNPTKRSKKS